MQISLALQKNIRFSAAKPRTEYVQREQRWQKLHPELLSKMTETGLTPEQLLLAANLPLTLRRVFDNNHRQHSHIPAQNALDAFTFIVPMPVDELRQKANDEKTARTAVSNNKKKLTRISTFTTCPLEDKYISALRSKAQKAPKQEKEADTDYAFRILVPWLEILKTDRAFGQSFKAAQLHQIITSANESNATMGLKAIRSSLRVLGPIYKIDSRSSHGYALTDKPSIRRSTITQKLLYLRSFFAQKLQEGTPTITTTEVNNALSNNQDRRMDLFDYSPLRYLESTGEITWTRGEGRAPGTIIVNNTIKPVVSRHQTTAQVLTVLNKWKENGFVDFSRIPRLYKRAVDQAIKAGMTYFNNNAFAKTLGVTPEAVSAEIKRKSSTTPRFRRFFKKRIIRHDGSNGLLLRVRPQPSVLAEAT